jgi:hypothetical protein
MKLPKALFGLAIVSAAFASGGAASAAANLSGSIAADNTFTAWLGTSATSLGTQVASGNSFTTATNFSGAALTAGVTNYLNFEVNNVFDLATLTAGPGGLSFVLNLTGTGFIFANGTTTFSSTAANVGYVKASLNTTFLTLGWTPATGAAQVVTNYAYGNVVGTNSWIDAATNGLNSTNCMAAGCTVDFTVAITQGTPTAPVPEPATWALMLAGFGMVGYAIRKHRVRTTVAYS